METAPDGLTSPRPGRTSAAASPVPSPDRIPEDQRPAGEPTGQIRCRNNGPALSGTPALILAATVLNANPVTFGSLSGDAGPVPPRPGGLPRDRAPGARVPRPRAHPRAADAPAPPRAPAQAHNLHARSISPGFARDAHTAPIVSGERPVLPPGVALPKSVTSCPPLTRRDEGRGTVSPAVRSDGSRPPTPATRPSQLLRQRRPDQRSRSQSRGSRPVPRHGPTGKSRPEALYAGDVARCRNVGALVMLLPRLRVIGLRIQD